MSFSNFEFINVVTHSSPSECVGDNDNCSLANKGL